MPQVTGLPLTYLILIKLEHIQGALSLMSPPPPSLLFQIFVKLFHELCLHLALRIVTFFPFSSLLHLSYLFTFDSNNQDCFQA